jgi:hypothetical protein
MRGDEMAGKKKTKKQSDARPTAPEPRVEDVATEVATKFVVTPLVRGLFSKLAELTSWSK